MLTGSKSASVPLNEPRSRSALPTRRSNWWGWAVPLNTTRSIRRCCGSHIDGTKEYVRLASDLGVGGVKVRPNNVHVDEGIPIEQTLEQIGVSLRECGEFARDLGVQIRLEVHGRTTSDPANIRKILDYADHDNVFVCWNSNATDLVDGSIDGSFAALQEAIALVHITELWSDYPWERLFTLLRQSGYAGYCLAEIPESPDPLRLMRYYRALWQVLAKR